MNKKKITILAIVLIISIVTISMAYFTDIIRTTATSSTSTLKIRVTDVNKNLRADSGKEVLSPGGFKAIRYDVENIGNISARLKDEIILTVLDKNNNPLNLSGDSETQSEFDLFKSSDIEFVNGQGYVPKAGVKPLAVKSLVGNTITYKTTEYFLSAESNLTTDYVLLFKNGVSSDFSNACLNINVNVFAIQQNNTNKAVWEVVESKKIL